MEIDNILVEKIFSAIRSSYKIDKHVDFFVWLQGTVREVLPHDMLLACWGEFDEKQKRAALNYDVASNISNVRTQLIIDASKKIDVFMHHLHVLWVNNNQRWFVRNHLNTANEMDAIHAHFPSELAQFNSLLVYGVSDVRGNNECLYVFFSQQNTFNVQDSVMGLVMPHIDSVLRKIQHLEPVEVIEALNMNAEVAVDLSGREHEILKWVRAGKTNQEIGDILFISQNTVKSHLKRIFTKLNVTTRAQAVGKILN